LYNSLYDIELTDWAKYGLKLPSVIRVHKIASLEKDMIDIKLGEVDEHIKVRTGNIIKALLK